MKGKLNAINASTLLAITSALPTSATITNVNGQHLTSGKQSTPRPASTPPQLPKPDLGKLFIMLPQLPKPDLGKLFIMPPQLPKLDLGKPFIMPPTLPPIKPLPPVPQARPDSPTLPHPQPSPSQSRSPQNYQ